MQALSQDELKKMVGYKAVDDYVKSGMVVGLGTGSTAFYAVERVGQKLKSGELTNVICIPTSEKTKMQALSLDIPLVTLNEKSRLDVSIDGADDVDPGLCLVKGGGGALLREKMVEIVSDKFICIVDESKLSKGLGPGFPLPVEITPFCHEHTRKLIEQLPTVKGCKAVLRMGSISNNKVGLRFVLLYLTSIASHTHTYTYTHTHEKQMHNLIPLTLTHLTSPTDLISQSLITATTLSTSSSQSPLKTQEQPPRNSRLPSVWLTMESSQT